MVKKRTKPRPTTKLRTRDDQEAERELQNALERTRWPKRFVCPRCGSEHKRTSYTKSQNNREKEAFRETLGIRCQQCKSLVSLTTGTLLNGTHLWMIDIRDAINIFLGASGSISAKALASKAKIAYSSAYSLIKKFRRAMSYRGEDLLEGKIQIDEDELVLRPAKSSRNIRIPIAVAVENIGDSPGRIALELLPGRMPYSWCVYLDAIKKGSTIETRKLKDHGDGLAFVGYVVKLAKGAEVGKPLPLCATVFTHVAETIRVRYRSAIGRENLQGVLNEIAFRWNNIHRSLDPDLKSAATVLMQRLLQPPFEKPPHEEELATYESWMALP